MSNDLLRALLQGESLELVTKEEQAQLVRVMVEVVTRDAALTERLRRLVATQVASITAAD